MPIPSTSISLPLDACRAMRTAIRAIDVTKVDELLVLSNAATLEPIGPVSDQTRRYDRRPLQCESDISRIVLYRNCSAFPGTSLPKGLRQHLCGSGTGRRVRLVSVLCVQGRHGNLRPDRRARTSGPTASVHCGQRRSRHCSHVHACGRCCCFEDRFPRECPVCRALGTRETRGAGHGRVLHRRAADATVADERSTLRCP